MWRVRKIHIKWSDSKMLKINWLASCIRQMETMRNKGSDSNIRQSQIKTNVWNRKCRNSPSTYGNLVYYKSDVANHWEKRWTF